MEDLIYLDNAATTPVDPEALAAAVPYLMNDCYGNPSSITRLGRIAREAVESARVQVARLINANPEQIIFTSGATEANNLVIHSNIPYDPYVVISQGEHDSLFRTVRNYCGCHKVLDLRSDSRVDFEQPIDRITGGRYLFAFSYTNNITGANNYLQEFQAIKRKTSDSRVLFHADCTQYIGTHRVDSEALGFDYISFSSHKLHGLKGTGCLYVKNPKDWQMISPMIIGGENQEFGLRGGTENVAGIVAFGTACEVLSRLDIEAINKRMQDYKEIFLDELSKKVSSLGGETANIKQNGESDTGILNLYIGGVDAQTLVLAADSMGVIISAGSACSSNVTKPNRILLAMGLPYERVVSSVRVSFDRWNTLNEVVNAARTLGEIVVKIRKGI